MTAQQQNAVRDTLFSTSEFLGPLWQVHNMQSRFEILKQRPLYFSGIYLELQNTRERFCNLPPNDLKKYFEALVCDGEHAVDVHMALFDDQKSWYQEVLEISRRKINECVYHTPSLYSLV
jgi:hypothetical protein